jgi:fructokinase
MIVSWGELLWDLFPTRQFLGGAPTNLAYHLAELGEKVALITRIGRDTFGEKALALLTAQEIDVSGVQVDAERATGQVRVTLDDSGEPHYQMVPGGAWEHIAFDASARALVERARMFCYGTFSQRQPGGFRSFEQAVLALPPKCLRICDANFRGDGVPPDVLRFALASAHVVKINQRELEELKQLLSLADPVQWMLQEQGAKLVAVTKSADGCTLYAPNEIVECPVERVATSGDRVGAGDAFCAALVVGILRGETLDRVARAANRLAGYVASVAGATPKVPMKVATHLFR